MLLLTHSSLSFFLQTTFLTLINILMIDPILLYRLPHQRNLQGNTSKEAYKHSYQIKNTFNEYLYHNFRYQRQKIHQQLFEMVTIRKQN